MLMAYIIDKYKNKFTFKKHIFKNQNPLALTADGKTIFESFFSGFNKAVKPILATQAKKSNAHLEKYRDEYSALKKSLEKNARKAS